MRSEFLDIVRRVMPTVIANELVGVQPMTGPVTTIFGSKSNWPGRVRMTKSHYGHFLRVYNRRKTHHPEYLTKLGYHTVNLQNISVARSIQDVKTWCDDTFQKGAVVASFYDFWFAYEQDYLMFKMRWL